MNSLFIAEVKGRSLLKLEGADRLSFLQGLTSNDVYKTNNNTAIYSTFLTPQGKFLYDFFLVPNEDFLWIDIESVWQDPFRKKLMLYKLRSQVSLSLEKNISVYAVWGENPNFSQHVGSIMSQQNNLVFYADPRLQELGLRVVGEKQAIEQWLAENNMILKSEEDYNHHRLSLGVPEGLQDLIQEKSTLLESNIDDLHAVDFNKGCYLGQELTARTKYRGLVRKKILKVSAHEILPEKLTELYYENDKVGEMRSSQNTIGLAYIRLEVLEKTNVLKTQNGQDIYIEKPFWLSLPEA
jgi:folate-binding protein YgfZ